MSWMDFGSTLEERKKDPAYCKAIEDLGRRTGIPYLGSVRPMLYPTEGGPKREVALIQDAPIGEWWRAG